MVYGCDETNGSWFCFIFFRMWWISTITAICIFISLWVCELILFEGISLHDPLFLLYGVCVSIMWVNLQNTFPFVFFFSPKGLFGFRFHLFKKFVSIVFPSYNYLLFLFHYYQLELQLNIRFRLWELSTLLFITQMIVAPPTLLLRLVSAMFKNRMLFFFCCGVSRMFRLLFLCIHVLFRLTQATFPEEGGGAYIAHNLKKQGRNGKE